MDAYALVTSITPGPVNIMALSYGTHHGWLQVIRFITGQAIGYALLLELVGFGLQHLLHNYPLLIQVVRWSGTAFLLFLAYKLFTETGALSMNGYKKSRWPFLYGALLQWLNPKAWLCSVAGISAVIVCLSGNLYLFTMWFVFYWLVVGLMWGDGCMIFYKSLFTYITLIN